MNSNLTTPCAEMPNTCPCRSGSHSNENIVEPIVLQVLAVATPGIQAMVKWNADDYYRHTNGNVKVEVKTAPTMTSLFEEVETDARAGGGLYDGYYTNPLALGTAAMLDGLHDLTPYVKASPHADWADVLLALRTYMTSFEGKIYILPLDGDSLNLYYRKDILAAHGLDVPRTWNEYNEVARTLDGTDWNGTRLSGSCVSRKRGDHAMYWYHMVLSSITQTSGASEGSLFDSSDMKPLLGEALAEMLRIHEGQVKYGAPDEFSGPLNQVHNGHMHDGSCGMTFMWGDMFRRSRAPGSMLHENLGIAAIPGSEVVLSRKTGKLERCTRSLCPYAKYYDDIGFVNVAPYAANGIWGGAVSANTTPEKQRALAEFFLWASSGAQSFKYTLPNSNLPMEMINGQDPWRRSQLDVDKWVEKGFSSDLAGQYVSSVMSNLVSKNVVVDVRFPKAGEVMTVLDEEVRAHLMETKHQSLPVPDDQAHTARMKVSEHISYRWTYIISKYDARGDTVAPLLEIYQRLRGVFVQNENNHYLTRVRPFGLALMTVVFVSSLGAAMWVYMKRESLVVKASQPPFLWLICFGTFVMGSSIYTTGIDDSVASQEGCHAACMITPWLLCLGFSITFAALCSKILRLKILMLNAAKLKRIKVKVQDVLFPFCATLVLNGALLVTWTLADPVYWERVAAGRTQDGQLESFGRCVSSGRLSDVMFALLVTINVLALLMANVLAYQTRNLKVSYEESKYVNLALFSILEALLIGVPILTLVDDPEASYMVRSLLVFVLCMAVLLFMFIPKFWKSSEISLKSMTDRMQDMSNVSGIDNCGPSGCPEDVDATLWEIATSKDSRMPDILNLSLHSV